MVFKNHGRQYDLVVFGANGYTGKLTAHHIALHLPSNLKWALAGRSESKLQSVLAECRELNPDRIPPAIELCNLDEAELNALAKKTFALITTVGPYSIHGEYAFVACAENGTHYFDATGETVWTARMIKRHESKAKASGALMFPQIGVESAPPDLCTWAMATEIRSKLSADTGAVTVSIHRLNSAPSGGTMETVFSIFEVFSLNEFREAHLPFALSPVPHPMPKTEPRSLLSKLTGVMTIPHLGLLTTSLAGSTDAPHAQRTWGLLKTVPSRERQAYGPNFTFAEYMRAKSWVQGVVFHYTLSFLAFMLATSWPFRKLARRFMYKPGDGPELQVAKKDEIEYRGVAIPDTSPPSSKKAICKAAFTGSMYYMTGLLLAEAALTVLEDDVELPGGVYTSACLGKNLIDRLDKVGFSIEAKIIED